MSRRTPALLLALATWILASPAVAQKAAGRAAAPASQLERARTAYAQGLELARRGEWERAAPLFELVYELGGFKNALWNLASCYRQLGRPATALATLERFLKHPRIDRRDRELALADIVALRGKAARLAVRANFDRAQVLIDGHEVGFTPLRDYDVNAGQHVVEVRAPGFQPGRREITVAHGTSATVTVELEPIPARVRVVTRPAGARIVIGGRALGISPLVEEVPPGVVEVEAHLDGHRVSRGRLVLGLGQQKEVNLELTRALSLLSLSVSPTGARVTFSDGTSPGRAPFAGRPLTPGPRVVEVSYPGHQSWRTPLRLRDGEAAALDVKLARGRLHPALFAATAAVGAGLLAGGGVLLAQSRQEAARFESIRGSLVRLEVAEGSIPGMKRRAEASAAGSQRRTVSGAALLGVGAASGATAAVLGFFTRWGLSRGTVEISATPGGVGLGARGNF